MPVIGEVIEQLVNATVFSILDMKNGFFHIDIKPSSRKYTSFVTPDGQYEFNKAPFGLSSSPAVFQRFVNTVFMDLIREGAVFAYMDDLIKPARSDEKNLTKLKGVLTVAAENGLLIQWKKC